MDTRIKTVFILVLGVLTASAPVFALESAFFDLRAFCLARGFEYYWDPVAKNAIARSSAGELRFHAGSAYALKENQLLNLPEKTYTVGNSFFVPKNVERLLLSVDAPVSYLAAGAAKHQIRRVIVDPGHGGKDPGALSRKGLKEKRLVLEIARKVKEELTARGLEVLMTRNSDVFIPLAERAKISNQFGADFFISIHANASTSPGLSGFEIYHLSEATDDTALAVERAENSALRFESAPESGMSKNLKTILWDLRESQNRKESLGAAKKVVESVSRSLDVGQKRIRGANFYVLKWTESPAILVELGYLTNRGDERKLRDSQYKARLAGAIVDGFWEYKKEFERTNGFTQ